MSWWTERRLLVGGVDALLGGTATTAARVGQRLDERKGVDRQVCATPRLAGRVRAQTGSGAVVVSDHLQHGVLDLGLFPDDRSPDDLAQVLAQVHTLLADLAPTAEATAAGLVVRTARDWQLVLPAGSTSAQDRPVVVEGLQRVDDGTLPRLLDELQHGTTAGVLLRLRAEQVAAVPAALLDRPGTRLSVLVTSQTALGAVAALTRRDLPLGEVALRLDASPTTVALGSLLATMTPRAQALSLSWSGDADAEVRSRVLGQLSMAFRGQELFTRWLASYERANLAPVAALTTCRSVDDGLTVVAGDVAGLPVPAQRVDSWVFAPRVVGEQDGQVAAAFDHPDPAQATSVRMADFTVDLLPYAAAGTTEPGGAGGGRTPAAPALRHLGTADDLRAFLADADAARQDGTWIDPASSSLENECAWLQHDCNRSPGRVVFSGSGRLRSSRRAVPLQLGVRDDVLRTALQSETDEVQARRGCDTCPAATTCSRCPSVPESVEALFCDARRTRPWLPAYLTALRLRQRYGTTLQVSGFPGPAVGPEAVAVDAPWLVAADGTSCLLAEVGGRRRVFRVPLWAGALVEAVGAGRAQEAAVAEAVQRSAATAQQCGALLARLAA